MSKTLIFLPLMMWACISNALSVNHYTVSVKGVFHNVTVAFEDLGKRANVRCVIKMNGKPVGRGIVNKIGAIIGLILPKTIFIVLGIEKEFSIEESMNKTTLPPLARISSILDLIFSTK